MANTPVLKSSEIISNVPLYDNVTSVRELMGAKEIPVSFTATNPVYVPVGAYIMFKGEQYTINTVPSVTKAGDHEYQYKVVFESVLYRLYDKKLRHLGNRSFQYFGTPAEYAKLIVANINEIDSGWTVGACDDLDPKPISFSGHTCRTALDVVAEAFQIEWDETSKVIRFTKQVGEATPHVFRYGQGKGLYSLSYAYQNDKNIVTRAYGYGSTKNLPEGYRAGATQLMFPGIYLENNVALYGVKEGDYENEDLYPKVAGTISDALDFDLEAGSFKVVDDSLSFNLNDFKSVEVPKLSFTTGELQGQNFDIISYNNTTKIYTLKVFVDGNNLRLPNATFKAQPGDTYTLFDMPLPNELLVAAESELKAKTLEWLQTNSKPQVLYSLELDPLYARANNILLEPGDRVTIVDEALGINELIRVSKVEYPVNFPEEITPSTRINIEIANFVPYTLTERVLSDIKENKQQVKTTISESNYIKRMAEYVKTLSGVDYLPPGTAIIDPATGSITANLINADFIVARNVITGKIRITAAANNIRMVDTATNKIIMLLDDDSALEGVVKSQLPPITDDQGVVRDPDFLYQRSEVVGGADTMFYYYAKRGVGATFGTPGEAVTSIGRAGIFSADTNGIIHMQRKLDLATGRGYIRDNVYNGLIYESLINKTSGLRMSAQFKIQTIGGINYVVADEVQTEVERMYNPNVIADAGDNGNSGGGGGGVILEPTDPIPTNPTTLKAKFPYNVGVAFKDALLNDTQYGGIVKTEFDQMTPENGCKFGKIRPNRATFNFNELNDNFNWAKANGLKVHLHYLLPGGDDKTIQWFLDMESLPNAAVEVEAEIRLHIKTVLQHVMVGAYAGMVVSIDIVNECLTGGGNVKDSMLKRLFGEQYIDIVIDECQKWAPNIPRLLNDFSFEYTSSKIEGLIALRTRIASRGYVLDGMGSQMHSVLRVMTETPESLQNFRDRIQLIADSGMMLHISELDVKCRKGTDGVDLGPYPFMNPQLEADQANFFVQVYKVVWEIMPQGKLLAVTVWSLDDNSNFENIPTMTDYTSIWYLENGIYKKRLAHQALLNMEIGTELEL